MGSRNQFTFYASFFESAARIRSKAARADLYDAICRYALTGEEPDLDKLPEPAAVAFINAQPNLEAGRRKAKAGSKGGSTARTSQSSSKANASKQEARDTSKLGKSPTEIEKEGEIEKEYECTPLTPHGEEKSKEQEFERLWEAYPERHRGRKEEAFEAFCKSRGLATKDGVIQERLEVWKQSEQWNKAGGQYIPSMKNWLLRATWQETPVKMAIPQGAGGVLGQAELEAIQRVLAMPDDDPL